MVCFPYIFIQFIENNTSENHENSHRHGHAYVCVSLRLICLSKIMLPEL